MSAWGIVGASSALSVLGSCLLLVESAYKKLTDSSVSFSDDKGFLVALLCISSGVLITTALASLTPQAVETMMKNNYVATEKLANVYLFFCVLLGISICYILNLFIHIFTSRSVVHCAHEVTCDSGSSTIRSASLHDASPSPGSPAGGAGSPQAKAADTQNGNDNFHARHRGRSHSHGHIHSHGHGHGHGCTQAAHSGRMHAPADHPNLHHRPSEPLLLSSDAQSERAPLLRPSKSHIEQHFALQKRPPYSSVRSTSSFTQRFLCRNCVGTCRGFDSLQQCAADIHNNSCTACARDSAFESDAPVPEVFLHQDTESQRDGECASQHSGDMQHSDNEADQLHHHHVVSKFSQMVSIATQTALALTLHKGPEGFLLFISQTADKNLGARVFLSLAIHNLFEGFMIACPLYIALNNKLLAVLVASLLGGASLPIGALAAYLMFPSGDLDDRSHFHLGLLVGVTTGFLVIISIQMLSAAHVFGGSQQTVLKYTLVGVVLAFGIRCF